MITRFDPPETIAQLRSVNTKGDDIRYDDCVVGIAVQDDGKVLQIDLRNLRPIRINDRGNLIIELELAEVLASIAASVADQMGEKS